MTLYHGASISMNGLIFHVDAGNPRSYPGTGINWYDMVGGSKGTYTTSTAPYNTGFGGYFSLTGSFNFNFSTTPLCNISNNLTMEAWVNIPSGSGGGGGVLVYGSTGAEQYSWNINGSNQFSLGTNWPASWYLVYPPAYTPGVWMQVVMTFSNSFWNTYYNTTFISNLSIPISTFPIVSGAYLTIGDNQPGGQEYMTGNIAIARVYNRVLSGAEILQNFTAHRGRFNI